MKHINFFNNLFSRVKEHSSPTVNRRSTDGQSQRQYSIGLMKYAAIITPAIRYVATLLVVLMVGFGQMWAVETSMPTSGSYSTNTKYAFSNSAVTGSSFYLAQRGSISRSSDYGWQPNNTGIALQVSSPVSLTFTIKSNTTSSRTITGQAYAVTDPFFNIYKNTTAGSQTLEDYVKAVNAKSAGSRSSEEAAIAAVSAFAAITGSADANKKLLICENPGAFSEAVAHGAAISHACPTTKGETNTFTVSLSAAGKYVIYLTSSGGSVGITTINIVPRKTIYMVPGDWNGDTPKFFVHSWGDFNDDVLMTLANCETNVFKADIPTNNTNLLFTRQDPSTTSIVYMDKTGNWNQSANYTIGSDNQFTFSGTWSDGEGKSTFNKGTYSAPTFTVTYNDNGGTSGSVPVDASSPYACSSSATVLGNTGSLAKTGKAFSGWNTKSNGSGTPYAPGANILNISDDIILYAQWVTAYSVSYDANGGSGSAPSDATPYANGATVTVLDKNTLTKSGYVFAGWNTKSDGSGTWYDPSETFSMGTKDVTLYAQWAECVSTIDFGASAAITETLAQAKSDLDEANYLYLLGGDTRYDNSSGYLGLKLKRTGDWIGFGVAAGYKVTITTQTVGASSHTVTADFSSMTALSGSTDNVYAADPSNARFFRIKSNDGSKAVVINKITIEQACSDPELAYGTSTVTKKYGDAAFTNTLTNSHSVTVSYASSNTDVATVNSITGEVTIKAAGTTTITASSSAQTVSEVKYCADEASYTLNVGPAVSVGPTAVAGNYGFRYSIGETIDLTATATGGSSYTYQWQKYVGTTWTDLADGVDATDGGTFSGVTTSRLQISGCTTGNVGSYRCNVTAGGQTNANDGYRVRVYTLYGDYFGGTLHDHAITWTGEYTGTVTLSLSAKRTYTFKITDNDGKWYGLGADNYVIQPVSSLGCGTDVKNQNIRLFTAPAGDYVVTIDITSAQIGDGSEFVGVSIAYPSVTHPNEGYVYLTKYPWRPYLHYWYSDAVVLTDAGGDPQLGEDQYTTICGNDYWCIPVIETYCNFIARDARISPTNTTGDQNTNGLHPGQNIYNDGTWKWQSIKKTITFDANGGSGSMDDITGICPGEDKTLPTNTFTRESWEFTGWNTNKYGTGTPYDDEATIEDIDADITLYAQWEKTVYLEATGDYTWWYNPDGSSNPAWFAIYYFDSEATPNNGWVTMELASCETSVYKATIPGNHFDKLIFVRKTADKTESWTGVHNQTVNIAYPTTNPKFTITGQMSCSCDDNGKLTGSWGSYSIPTFTISYAKGSVPSGGGSITGSKDNESKTCAIDFTLPSSAIFTTTGYTQTGWATSNGGPKAYELGGTYEDNAAQAFYPFWTVQSFTLTWDLVGGTVTVAGTGAEVDDTGTPSSSVNYGAAITKPTVTKTGYDFAGWDETPASTMPAANTTYTATWTAQTYTISYKDQGNVTYTGSNLASLPTSHTYGVATALVAGVKTGYTFVGWFTDADCTVSAGMSIGTTAITADITLYAKWTAKQTTITIDANMANHGSTAPSSFTATYDQALPSFTAATGAAGYSLKGYYTDATGGTKVIDADGTFSANSGTWNRTDGATLTLYAQYEDASYGVTHTLSNVTKSSGGTTATHGTDYTAVFAAAGDYELPASITVTIGGSTKTDGTEYTWTQGTGTVEITGSYITGAIVITVTGEEEGDCTPSRLAKVTLASGKDNVSVTDSACTDSHNLEKTGKIGSSGYLLITPSTALKSGDVVTVTIGVGDYCTSRLYMRYGGTSSTDTISVLTNQTSGSDATVSFTLTKDSARISFTRATGRTSDNTAQNHVLKSVIISRPCAETTYELTWNTNGGSELVCTGTCTSGDLEPGTTLVAPTDPTLSNYTFDGWKTANDGTGSAAAATMPSADTEYFAAWKQIVTLKTGAQGSGADKTPYVYINGATVNGFSAHTATGYTLQGYYSAPSGGTKVLNDDGSFAGSAVTDYITAGKWSRTGAAPTLFAQWRAAAGKTCYTWDAAETTPETGTNNYGGLYLTASTVANNQKVSSTLTDTVFNVSDNGKSLKGHINGAVIDSLIFSASTSDSKYTTFVASFCSTQTFDTAKIIKVGGYHCTVYNVPVNTADCTQIKIKAPTGTKSFVLSRNFMSDKLTSSASLSNSGKRYLYYIKACSASGGTHTISYDAGGGTGTMASNTGITDDGSQTLTTNSFTAPANYSFAGWVADGAVTIGGSTVTAGTLIANGALLTNITTDIALTAKWSQTITLDDNDANHGATGDGSATVYYNATSLASISHTTAASGYKLAGYYTEATSGTKVLNSDGSFAGDDITDWIDDGKWTQSTTSTPTLYAQYEASGSIKWNLQVNSADAPIVTSSKNSSYTQISTSNMSNLTNSGLTVTASKKSELTSLISTPDTKDDDCMYVTFKVATGYKFTPSLIKAIIQPVGNGEHKAVEFSLADESSHTLANASATKCDGTSDGKKTTVTLAGDGTYFTGTVTLKIFVYKHADGTNSTAQYRLGTPIQIDGEIAEACTMPSYTSVSYSQTEYVQPASASAISVVGASGDPSYQWKYNSTGDRTSGTNCGTEASVTPSTESTGTLYYWCELTNACGTVKTPAVAITVSASKSTATVTWTDPSTPNYGGGGYTIKATVNEAWNGNASDLIITAPAGIRIYDKTSGTDGSGKKYVQVKFDVQTALDRSTYEDKIPFTVSADATATYNAISIDHNLSYSACSGGGGSATEELMAVDASHIDNSTWKGGWVYDGIGMMRYGHGSSDISAGTKDANLKDLSYTMASGDITKYYKSASNHFGFYTEKAITGIRLYVYTSNDNVTVNNVYVANSAYTSGTPSSGAVSFEAEYNDENDALRTGTHSGSAWVDITFDKEVAAEKYGQINLSNNVNIAGMAFISASGSGATLTTTLAFATTGTIAKTQSAANFTNAASVTAYSETLGAITYSSSNTDCATVDSKTGEVTITASGASDQSTTITATLAASGCYKGATTTYTITVAGVSCTVNHGTLASGVTTKCSTADATLTLTGFDSGATVQWYKGESTISDGVTYDITTEGTTSTMVTKEVGTYSVIVTKDECSDRSNSITISNYSAEVAATKIVDKWYIKHGRVTPDIALWALDEGTHLSSVAWLPSNATGLTAADDFYESDGIVYLKGTEPSSNESSDVEYTLTLTVKDECENTTALSTSDKQITLTHQKNTDKHVLAFVVTGTEKGGWTAGISADQTTSVELYNEIAKNFDVQATNIYSTDDEQKLKEYYSQFDILCITDYPNTKTTGTNKKSYVDAIGSLIDIRPILTMEAWVSGLTNWKSKGISGTPKSPTTRQYSMLLQCKDHEIFSGTNPTTVGSGDETMYRIDMVDKTQEEYATLDATYGEGVHQKDEGYQYGKKPALQGFTYDASMSSLLPIGRIDDGADNDLEVGVERQEVMEARLLVLGINSYAMERLEDDGQTIVINALKYLMKKDAEDISDCSNYFLGGAEGDETNWFNLENWSGSTLPDRTQEVRIVAPCIIGGNIARAASVKIITGGKFNHGSQTANGSLTINPTGSLIVDGKIYAATAPNFFEKRTTEPENLIVKADADHTGTLIFDNEDGETQATIEMYSKSYWETVEGKYKKYWSYVGMPIKDVHIPDYFYGAFTYYYNETAGWERRFDNDIMQPFEGIGLSMQTGHMETFKGTMVSTENVDIKLTSTTGYGDGDNLIGNSWTAPIQIANFDASDFGDALATIYIFNTGREGNTYVDATVENKGVAKAGQWLGVPISVAGLEEYTGLKVVPAMNAFLVYNDEGAGTTTTMHLDYEKLVRDGASSNTQINEPMRAPKQDGRRKKKDVEGLMRIRVAGEKTNTDVWMMQDPRFSEAFDNGWEAYYTTCDDRSAQLYARSSTGKMSFLALPDLDGTVIGFAPSRDGNDYTFTFKYRGEDEYYLNDLKLQQSVLINADNTYDFIYEKGDANRFYVSRTPLQAPQTPTGIGNTEGTSTQSVKAIKVIYNDKLYIIRGGRVYGADGSLVK